MWKLLLLFGVVLAAGHDLPHSRLLCPLYCKCTYSGLNQGVAKCTTLDPPLQKFSSDIRHLIVKQSTMPVNLTADIFAQMGLKDVAVIKIINSSVSYLDVHAFRGLTELISVDLSDNKLMLIHPDTFKEQEDLRHLFLSGNPLQLTQLLPPMGHYVLRSESLSELSLSRCHLTQLSKHAFSQLKNLDYLDLSSNQLTHINPDVFAGLDVLAEINLSDNDISVLSPDVFSNIGDMTSLHLSNNPIKNIRLPSLPELKELDISGCGLQNITGKTFDAASEVSTLNLSSNAIEIIKSDAFFELSSLRYLDLSFNKLKGHLPKILFENNQNLETLTLAGNKDLKDLSGFEGDFNSLYLYDISQCGIVNLNSEMFRNMHYISTLNVSGNEIARIDSKTFISLTSLTVLDLSNNHLHMLHPNMFASNREMSRLYISGNLFHHLPASLFRPLPKLYYLDASHNNLYNLWNSSEADIMKSENILGSLTHLYVNGNRLKHLHIFSFSSLEKLQVLNVEDNPFECSKGFGHTIEWLSRHRIHPNAGKSSRPINMIVDDVIENNRKWADTFDIVCPKLFLTGSTPTAETNEPKVKFDIKTDEFEDNNDEVTLRPHVKTTELINIMGYNRENNLDDSYQAEFYTAGDSEYYLANPFIVFGLFVIFVMFLSLNVALIMYIRSRRNYTLVGISPYSAAPSLPKFNLRKGQRNAYQKLYEECSVPNTPIVRNANTLSIISVFGKPEQGPINNV